MLIGPSSRDIALGGDSQVAASIDVVEETIALLVPEADISPFEGLVPRHSEPIGAPSLYCFPGMAQYIMSTMLSNLMAAAEAFNMTRLIKEAFQCLSIFNLDLRKVCNQVFDLLC